MRILNTFIKNIVLFFLHIFTFIQCYLLSILFTGSILSVIMAGLSIFYKWNEMFDKPYWKLLLVCSIPFGVIYFIIIEFDLIKTFKKWRKQEKEVE